jgi:uncharacterized BrkB/YihY/UPF0761 family membrane protein
MAEEPGSPEPARSTEAARALARNRRREIMVGLLCSFLGIALLSLLLPVNTPSLVRVLPAAAAGLALLWAGGILMGNGMRPFGRRHRTTTPQPSAPQM